MARLALTACLAVTIHTASANDYPPPPGPYKSATDALHGVSPAVGVGRKSAGSVSAVQARTARALATGSSRREQTKSRYGPAVRSGPSPRGHATERFRPAAATEYSQPPALPRPAATLTSPGNGVFPPYAEKRRDATPRSPSRAFSAPGRSGDLIDTSAASAAGDARVVNGATAFRTDRPRSPADSREPAQRMPQAPVFRPPDTTDR